MEEREVVIKRYDVFNSRGARRLLNSFYKSHDLKGRRITEERDRKENAVYLLVYEKYRKSNPLYWFGKKLVGVGRISQYPSEGVIEESGVFDILGKKYTKDEIKNMCGGWLATAKNKETLTDLLEEGEKCARNLMGKGLLITGVREEQRELYEEMGWNAGRRTTLIISSPGYFKTVEKLNVEWLYKLI